MTQQYHTTPLFIIVLTISLLVRGQSECNVPSPTTPYTFSICTMIQDEAKYIEEWVTYHMLLNVDHFYVYNHKSGDNIEQVLSPYIKKGLLFLC